MRKYLSEEYEQKTNKKRKCFISNIQAIKAKKQAGINQRCHLSITM